MSLAYNHAQYELYTDLAGLHDWLEGATYSLDGEQLAWAERCMAWLDKEVEKLRQ